MLDAALNYLTAIFSFLVLLGTIHQIHRIRNRKKSGDISLVMCWICFFSYICWFLYVWRLNNYYLAFTQGGGEITVGSLIYHVIKYR